MKNEQNIQQKNKNILYLNKTVLERGHVYTS